MQPVESASHRWLQTSASETPARSTGGGFLPDAHLPKPSNELKREKYVLSTVKKKSKKRVGVF